MKKGKAVLIIVNLKAGVDTPPPLSGANERFDCLKMPSRANNTVNKKLVFLCALRETATDRTVLLYSSCATSNVLRFTHWKIVDKIEFGYFEF